MGVDGVVEPWLYYQLSPALGKSLTFSVFSVFLSMRGGDIYFSGFFVQIESKKVYSIVVFYKVGTQSIAIIPNFRMKAIFKDNY